MSKSLAELRQSPHSSLPERTYEVCLSQRLVAEVQALVEEEAALAEQARKPAGEDGEQAGPPLRVGEQSTDSSRLEEIEQRKDALLDEMRDHTGTLRLRGTTSGEWRRWVAANPARTTEREGRQVPILLDEAVAYGFCNADALMDSVGSYVVAWNDEPLATGDWDWLAERIPPGDLKELARVVVQMHEVAGVKAPKLQRAWSATSPSENS